MNTDTKKAIIASLIITCLLIITTLVIYQRFTYDSAEREKYSKAQKKALEAEVDSLTAVTEEYEKNLTMAGQTDSLVSRFINYAQDLTLIGQRATDEPMLIETVEGRFARFLKEEDIMEGYEQDFLYKILGQFAQSLKEQQITARKVLFQKQESLSEAEIELQLLQQRTNNPSTAPSRSNTPPPAATPSAKTTKAEECSGMAHYAEADIQKIEEKAALNRQVSIAVGIQSILNREPKQKTFLGVGYTVDSEKNKLEGVRKYVKDLLSKK